MNIRPFVIAAIAGLALVAGCRQQEPGTPLGTTYAEIARSTIWRVLPRSQAESLGLKPGDAIIGLAGQPVRTIDDLWRARQFAADSARATLTVLRGDEELEFSVTAAPLGILTDAGRYPSSLAIALKDILASRGAFVDYDWLAAGTGESFTLTAKADECPMDWPGVMAGEDLDDFKELFGLELSPVFAAGADDSAAARVESESVGVPAVNAALAAGRTVLVLADWSEDRFGYWGVVTRFDPDDSLFYGYTLGAAGETPLTGPLDEAYEVRYRPARLPEPERLLGPALGRALELGQAYADSGWQSGIAAYDVLIAKLDSVPFCPVCGDASQDCFDDVVWTTVANKESASRLFDDMREAMPDQAELIDEIIGVNEAIVVRYAALGHSGTSVGTLAGQERLARALGDIQRLEADLLGLYEELLGEL
jgi:hypothetical protein